MKKKHLILLICALIPIVSLIVANTAIWLSPSLSMGHSEEYNIYDDKDDYAFSYHFHGLASYMPLKNISPYFLDAIICSEDQRFYQHHGLDYKRIVASLFANIKNGEIVAGGSTITQQLARTLYLNNEKSLWRKIKEACLARKLEMAFSKEQILEAYVNSVYFGHNIYGIDEASHYFFNKKPTDLKLEESAMLAGIISAPSYYSPDVSLKASEQKKEQVLRIMFNKGKITSNQFNEAMSSPLKFYFKKDNNINSHIMYYYDAINAELEKHKLLTSDYKNMGMDVYSSLDLNVMNKVTNIINAYQINEQENQVAVVVMKPNSGDVLALVGGVNYESSPFNRATSSLRQTGSTIKPLLYYLALEYGMSVKTQLISEKTTFHLENVGDYSPSNATNKYANGPISMLEALALSDNIYATKTLLLVGSENLKNLLQNLGVSHAINNPTIGLGTNEMTPLQLAAIYNTFASEGKYYEPHIVRKVTLQNDKVVYKASKSPKYNLNRDNVILMNYLLTAPFDHALTSYTTPSLVNYPTQKTFGAKTGSTESDSWVVGFNPHYTILVYVGTDENKPLTNGKLAKQLFVSIANSLTQNDSDIYYKTNAKMRPFHLKNNNLISKTYYYIN